MAEIFKSQEPEKDRIIDYTIDESGQLSVFEKKILQVRREAEELRAEAQNIAETIVNDARSEADGIRDAAYNEGVEKGKAESLARIDELAKSLENEIDKVHQSHAELMRKAQTGIIDFVFKLSKLIIGSEITKDPSIIEKHLERILDRLTVDGKVEISVSSEDYETIETYLRESGFNMDSSGYEIKVDASLERGGIRVNTPSMGIDGSLEGMLQRVESVIRDMLGENE